MSENKKSIGIDLKKFDAHVIQPHEYDEAPEWTAEDFARAEIKIGDRVIRRGRPPLVNPKKLVSLRLDDDLIEHFKRRGAGWQTRINATLRKAVKIKARKRA
jgi:uncharacterized protein (DUF4415 family)